MTHTALSLKMRYIMTKTDCFHEQNMKCGVFSLCLGYKSGGRMNSFCLRSLVSLRWRMNTLKLPSGSLLQEVFKLKTIGLKNPQLRG